MRSVSGIDMQIISCHFQIEYLTSWVDYYQISRQGELVGILKEFQDQQEKGTTQFVLPQSKCQRWNEYKSRTFLLPKSTNRSRLYSGCSFSESWVDCGQRETFKRNMAEVPEVSHVLSFETLFITNTSFDISSFRTILVSLLDRCPPQQHCKPDTNV